MPFIVYLLEENKFISNGSGLYIDVLTKQTFKFINSFEIYFCYYDNNPAATKCLLFNELKGGYGTHYELLGKFIHDDREHYNDIIFSNDFKAYDFNNDKIIDSGTVYDVLHDKYYSVESMILTEIKGDVVAIPVLLIRENNNNRDIFKTNVENFLVRMMKKENEKQDFKIFQEENSVLLAIAGMARNMDETAKAKLLYGISKILNANNNS